MVNISTTAQRVKSNPRKASKKPERRCRTYRQGTESFLRLTIGTEITDYRLTALSSDLGRAFRVEKLANGSSEVLDSYDVCIGAGDCSTCCCKGFSRWATCKHVDSLAALVAASRL